MSHKQAISRIISLKASRGAGFLNKVEDLKTGVSCRFSAMTCNQHHLHREEL